jgi:hypothetical protein
MSDTCADIGSVRRFVQQAGWRRIGIDGIDGAGKTYLAEQLAEALGCPVLDVEDYAYKNQGGYVDFIDYPALSGAMSSMPSFILCGACLLEVLANIGATVDGHIYIKRMRNGLWVDEDECVFPDGVDAAIENLARDSATLSDLFDERADQLGQVVEDSLPRLSTEIMRYHDMCAPHEVADLIFERSDEPG